MNEIIYKIDGVDLSGIGVNISSSDGVIDKLSIKGVTKVSHPGEHGEDVDLSEYRYNVRKLSFECFMVAANNTDLVKKYEKFATLLGKNRLIRLEIFPDRLTTLAFDVYCADGITFIKEWDAEGGEVVADFTLNLIEPQPVKKVFVTTANAAAISIDSDTPLQISWGDGVIKKYCFSGEHAHTFTDGIKKHFIIVSGVITETNVITNLKLVCSVLL